MPFSACWDRLEKHTCVVLVYITRYHKISRTTLVLTLDDNGDNRAVEVLPCSLQPVHQPTNSHLMPCHAIQLQIGCACRFPRRICPCCRHPRAETCCGCDLVRWMSGDRSGHPGVLPGNPVTTDINRYGTSLQVLPPVPATLANSSITNVPP